MYIFFVKIRKKFRVSASVVYLAEHNDNILTVSTCRLISNDNRETYFLKNNKNQSTTPSILGWNQS